MMTASTPEKPAYGRSSISSSADRDPPDDASAPDASEDRSGEGLLGAGASEPVLSEDDDNGEDDAIRYGSDVRVRRLRRRPGSGDKGVRSFHDARAALKRSSVQGPSGQKLMH